MSNADQKTFLALFVGSASDAEKTEVTREQQQAFMEQWIRWAAANEASIVDSGTPLGPTTRVDADGPSDARNHLVTYTIVRAVSRDDAAEILAEHPHLGLAPGNSIEIMERLPTPNDPSDG